jgi:acetyl-CoA carboxylase carboxyl transferase subunit alpha
MSIFTLDFEKTLKDLDDKISNLDKNNISAPDYEDSIASLKFQIENEKKRIYSNLSRWQTIQIARHALRPHTSDYIKLITTEWIEIHGDRKYADDSSIITGVGKIDDINCVIVGQEKGRSTKDKLFRNFGMVRPEGYRKALRVMKIAEKFDLPIITFIDTPGAYPGIGAEERGQSQAIADNLFCMSSLRTPILSIVIGEGASGGALAIGLCDKLICLEYTWFSVISPEGCASILFHDTSKSKEAADSMKVSSKDLLNMKIADEILSEPAGGAHHDLHTMSNIIRNSIIENINNLKKINKDDLVKLRLQKYENIGHYSLNNNENHE